MLNNLLNNPFVQTLITITALLLVAVCMFPVHFPDLAFLSNYASVVMLALLFFGVLFLILRQSILTFVFFGACVLLSVFLKFSVQNDSLERWRETVVKDTNLSRAGSFERPIRVAHFNTTNFNEPQQAMQAIRNVKADVISFHEINPFWDQWLKDSLSSLYPFSQVLVDIGLFGQAIFSCYPITETDTIFYNSVPMLTGTVVVEDSELRIISIHTEPVLTRGGDENLRKHLGNVVPEVEGHEKPTIVVGDFNCVSWSNALKEFKNRTGLLDSRSGFLPFSTNGLGSLFEAPVDHILYSPSLQCIGFENLECKTNLKRLGICGSFLFRKKSVHVSKAG